MTDYASSVAAAEPSWTWWMTTAAAAAMRMQSLRDHHRGNAADGSYSDADDECAGPERKRPRVAKDEYWTAATATYGRAEDGSREYDSAAVGPLDLSVKATLTTATARVTDGRAMNDGRKAEQAAKTPAKRSAGANGRSSKKSTGKTTGGASAAAVKAATRKLLPQLLQDQRVDRSSPVSGTIIVPATPDRNQSTTGRLTSPPSPYAAAADFADGDRQDDDYDGDDIDPEFNVVEATDEARRRLESIPNALGPYRCRLCSVRYVDAFALARHRCRCIVHVRYRCPECDKVFQCPANLASHRRWHGAGVKSSGVGNNNNNNNNNNNDTDNNDSRSKGTTEADGTKLKQETITTSTSTTTNIITNNSKDDDQDKGQDVVASGETTVATSATSTTTLNMNMAGFKKNILQRAVQAAAAAAAAAHENIRVTKNVT